MEKNLRVRGTKKKGGVRGVAERRQGRGRRKKDLRSKGGNQRKNQAVEEDSTMKVENRRRD